jgi:hypothetical protein
MNVRYRITLTSEEREELRSMVQAGKGPFRRLKRAQILLAASSGSSDVAIVRNLSVGASKPPSPKNRVRAPTASSRRRKKRYSSRQRARRHPADERAGRSPCSLERWFG